MLLEGDMSTRDEFDKTFAALPVEDVKSLRGMAEELVREMGTLGGTFYGAELNAVETLMLAATRVDERTNG